LQARLAEIETRFGLRLTLNSPVLASGDKTRGSDASGGSGINIPSTSLHSDRPLTPSSLHDSKLESSISFNSQQSLSSLSSSITNWSTDNELDESSSGNEKFDNLCKVCYDQPINSVLLRCGHVAICFECSKHLDKCPICRSEIQEVIQTFRV